MGQNSRKGKPPVTQVTIICAILIIAIVGYYCYLVNRNNPGDREVKATFTQNVLMRNMENNYPPTVKEVVKYYNDVMKCFYNEDCTEEEITDLAKRARELYDDELVEHNPWSTYIVSLENEIDDFKENKRKITSFSVAASTDVDYFEADGYHFAKIRSGYNILQGKESSSSILIYLLRKDDKGHWKIYGWERAPQ